MFCENFNLYWILSIEQFFANVLRKLQPVLDFEQKCGPGLSQHLSMCPRVQFVRVQLLNVLLLLHPELVSQRMKVLVVSSEFSVRNGSLWKSQNSHSRWPAVRLKT